MNKTNDPSRLGGTLEQTTESGECLTFRKLLPADFPDRLERFREAADLSWSGLAAAIGVDYKQMYKWRRGGVEPSGGAIHSLYLFASRLPNGLDILMGEDFQMSFFESSPVCPACRRRINGKEGPTRKP